MIEPIGYFSKFFSDKLLDEIVNMSNHYANQKNFNLILISNELVTSVGILLQSSVLVSKNDSGR